MAPTQAGIKRSSTSSFASRGSVGNRRSNSRPAPLEPSNNHLLLHGTRCSPTAARDRSNPIKPDREPDRSRRKCFTLPLLPFFRSRPPHGTGEPSKRATRCSLATRRISDLESRFHDRDSFRVFHGQSVSPHVPCAPMLPVFSITLPFFCFRARQRLSANVSNLPLTRDPTSSFPREIACRDVYIIHII